MRTFRSFTAALLLLSSTVIGARMIAPPIAMAERSVDGDEELLPIYETEAERALRALLPVEPLVSDPPPIPPVRNVAEYEPCTGALIRYPLGIPYNLIHELVETAIVHVVVASSVHATAVSNFVAQGVDTSRVRWVIAPNNSIWTRDYGPWFVFDGNGDQVIMDHHYNRPARPDDDVIPQVLGGLWGIPVVTHDLWHTGGNYMTEGHGLSYSTDLVWNENAGMTHGQIADFMQDYYGVDDYKVMPDISPGGIHHIDCWGKLLDEETVLVKQVLPSHVDYSRVEANAAAIAGYTNKYGRPFRVVRVFCPSIPSGNVAAYTNSLILNNKVFVPTFNKPVEDAAALQAYRDNMPGYEVIGYFYSQWITDDALHCRVMGIADRYMLRVDHNPVQEGVSGLPIPISMFADDRSESGLDMSGTVLRWRFAGGSAFTTVPFAPDAQPDWYLASIPAQTAGTEIEYYVTAADLTGRVASRPRPAPAAVHRFTVEAATGVIGQGDPAGPAAAFHLAATPSPFHSRTMVRFRMPVPGHATVRVFDVTGREVANLADRSFPAGEQAFEWSTRGAGGIELAPGVYTLVLETAGRRITQRAVLAR